MARLKKVKSKLKIVPNDKFRRLFYSIVPRSPKYYGMYTSAKKYLIGEHPDYQRAEIVRVKREFDAIQKRKEQVNGLNDLMNKLTVKSVAPPVTNRSMNQLLNQMAVTSLTPRLVPSIPVSRLKQLGLYEEM